MKLNDFCLLCPEPKKLDKKERIILHFRGKPMFEIFGPAAGSVQFGLCRSCGEKVIDMFRKKTT